MCRYPKHPRTRRTQRFELAGAVVDTESIGNERGDRGSRRMAPPYAKRVASRVCVHLLCTSGKQLHQQLMQVIHGLGPGLHELASAFRHQPQREAFVVEHDLA